MKSCMSRIVFYRTAILATLTRPHPLLCEDIPPVSFLRSTWSFFLLFRSSSIFLILLIVTSSHQRVLWVPRLKNFWGNWKNIWVLSRETLPEEIGAGAWSISRSLKFVIICAEKRFQRKQPESRSSGKIEVWHFLRQRNNPKGNWRSLIEIEAWHLF